MYSYDYLTASLMFEHRKQRSYTESVVKRENVVQEDLLELEIRYEISKCLYGLQDKQILIIPVKRTNVIT